LGGQRGRLISTPDREKAIELIDEAHAAGARKKKCCEVLGIGIRTYQRWKQGDTVKADGRTQSKRVSPANKLGEAEREQILEIANSEEYSSLPPSQIVPALADKGIYIASESSFYRVLKEAGQQNHRGRSKKREPAAPSTHEASGPNQVWSWDITWLPGPVKGVFYYLYMMLDIFSRKLVAQEVYLEGVCSYFCVNGNSSFRKPSFEFDCEKVQGGIPVLYRHGPFFRSVIQSQI